MVGESEEVLVQRSRSGDPRAFGEIAERYQGVLYNLALRMTGHAEDARDVVQTTFTKAYRALGTYDPKRKFFSWIYRIAFHECINLLRRGKRTEPLEWEPPSHERSPEDRMAALEIEQLLQEALLRLSEEHRQVIVLRHFMDLSYAEIGDVLKVEEKTVKSRLFDARRRLRTQLKQRGVEQ
jgi:RNA polymerase sigma-70 factor (ECF subfamily)